MAIEATILENISTVSNDTQVRFNTGLTGGPLPAGVENWVLTKIIVKQTKIDGREFYTFYFQFTGLSKPATKNSKAKLDSKLIYTVSGNQLLRPKVVMNDQNTTEIVFSPSSFAEKVRSIKAQGSLQDVLNALKDALNDSRVVTITQSFKRFVARDQSVYVAPLDEISIVKKEDVPTIDNPGEIELPSTTAQ